MRRSQDLAAPKDLIDAAVFAVRAAGNLIQSEFHRPDGPRGAGSKAQIDTQIETFLKQFLLKLHACNWHGEELPRHAVGHDDTWVVDPHDGTRGFLRGLRGSAISVALVRRGTPVLGIVYAPLAPDDFGDMFTWAEGLPAQRNGVPLGAIGPNQPTCEIDDGVVSLPAARPQPIRYDADTVIAMNEDADQHADHNAATLGPASVLATPSIAYRLALAAAGEADIAVSFVDGIDAYDIAGGHALLVAVGGALVQKDGRPVGYNGSMTYRGCLGGRPELIDPVRRRVKVSHRRAPNRPPIPRRRTSSGFMLRGAHGALLGQLVGDALGSYVEFQSADRIKRDHPGGVVDLRPGGTWDLVPGQPTDDSEMALALSRSILAAGRFDRAAVARAYADWGRSQPFDIGTTTRAGLSALEGHGRPVTASQSNGALMRVSPIGILAAGRPALAARLGAEDARLTHPNPICQAASAAQAAAIAAGIAGADNRGMWAAAHAHVGTGDGAEAVRECLEAAQYSIQTRPSCAGWVLTALSNAFHRLWTGEDFEPALIETVAMGGDTDTNAAICGALLGAALGRDAIPLRWRRKVLSCRTAQAPGMRRPRPSVYWPDQALDMAEALLGLGSELN